MPQSVDDILAGAKKTLAEEEQKFPSANAPTMPQPDKPSTMPAKSDYSAARQARKTPTMVDEMKAKSQMVDKAKQALSK